LLSNFTMHFYVKTFAQMEKERAELAQTKQTGN
jgi:type IV pilus assembly protein PilN